MLTRKPRTVLSEIESLDLLCNPLANLNSAQPNAPSIEGHARRRFQVPDRFNKTRWLAVLPTCDGQRKRHTLPVNVQLAIVSGTSAQSGTGLADLKGCSNCDSFA